MDSLCSGAVRYGHYNDFCNTDGLAMLVTSVGERYIESWANGTRKTVEKRLYNSTVMVYGLIS